MHHVVRRFLNPAMSVGFVLASACGGDDGVTPPDQPTVASVAVTAPRTAIVTGDTLTLTAAARDAAGQSVSGKAVSWTTSNASVATVSSSGLVRGIDEGDATITASVEGRSGSAQISVRMLVAETTRQISASIGPAGDTLTTTNAAGATFSLEIPAGALQTPVTISMTPIAGVKGAQFSGGLMGAVQFAPSGQRFLRPVRLRITGLPAPTGGRVPFGFVAADTGGIEALLPAAFSNGTLTLLVPHFSVVGGGAELPSEIAGIVPQLGPCGTLRLSILTALVSLNAARPQFVEELEDWGLCIRPEIVAAATGTVQLLDGLAEFVFWEATIAFIEALRPDLAGLSNDALLSGRRTSNSAFMVEGLDAGIARDCNLSRSIRSLERAEVALFWQEQAQVLGLGGFNLLGLRIGPNLSRANVLQYFTQNCLAVVLDTASLAEPLEIGQSAELITTFKVQFVAQPVQDDAPFRMRLNPVDVTVAPEQGFTDGTGQFVTSAIPESSARSTGLVTVGVRACLIFPSQAAQGQQAQASDVCETEIVQRAVVLYSNNFSGTVGPEWSVSTTATSPSGQRFLGELDNTSVLLAVDSLPPHSKLLVEFDLYIIASWNGNGGPIAGPPDLIEFAIPGGALLKRTTFSNKPRDPQAYPGDFPGASFPAKTGALTVGSLGFPPGPDFDGDAVYRIRLTFPHTGNVVSLQFNGQHAGQIERWGLDNVRLSIAR